MPEKLGFFWKLIGISFSLGIILPIGSIYLGLSIHPLATVLPLGTILAVRVWKERKKIFYELDDRIDVTDDRKGEILSYLREVKERRS